MSKVGRHCEIIELASLVRNIFLAKTKNQRHKTKSLGPMVCLACIWLSVSPALTGSTVLPEWPGMVTFRGKQHPVILEPNLLPTHPFSHLQSSIPHCDFSLVKWEGDWTTRQSCAFFSVMSLSTSSRSPNLT